MASKTNLLNQAEFQNGSGPQSSSAGFTLPADSNPEAFDVYQAIHDQLQSNVDPFQNFASFVNVSMEHEAIQLIFESLNINLADTSIYTATAKIKKQIIHMAADLLHADFVPGSDDFIGTATVGSSEAVMLGILAHKQRWLNWYDALPSAQKPKDGRVPNMIIGGAYQICWEKAYKYFEIAGLGDPSAGAEGLTFDPTLPPQDRCRIIPLEPKQRIVTAESIRACLASGQIDENTIVVNLVLGTTQTAEMDEIIEINQILKSYNDQREREAEARGETAYRIPIHVDAAFGGFLLPFTEPELEWDFRASEVQSINVSNHKFGQVLPGLGMVLFRDPSVVPPYLFSKINYLGEQFDDFGLNFSRSSWPIISQYYNFLRYGRAGYRRWAEEILSQANQLKSKLLAEAAYADYFELLTEIGPATEDGQGASLRFPSLILRVKPSAPFSAKALSAALASRGWLVPAYTLPPKLESVTVLRLVVKAHLNAEMIERFVEALTHSISDLCNHQPV
ncbi:MAG: pyridoxal-dependent decarboxylase [Chloroflexota bacterium]